MLVLNWGKQHPGWGGGLWPPCGSDGFRHDSYPAWGLPRGQHLHACALFLCASSSCLPPPPHLPCPLLLPQVPSAPRRFRVRQPNLETINLEWDHPEHPNGILIGYTLKYVACTFRPFFLLIWESETPFSPTHEGIEAGSLWVQRALQRDRGTWEKFPMGLGEAGETEGAPGLMRGASRPLRDLRVSNTQQ